MKSTKVIINYFFLIFFLIGCKNVKEQELVTSKNTKLKVVLDNSNSNLFFQDSIISKLPNGDPLLLSNKIEKKLNNKESLKNLFHYYDTINGIPSPNFNSIKISKYITFYKPTKADTIYVKDKFALQSKTNYSYFNLVKILPTLNSNQILIFEGKSTNQDYDGNLLHTNRKDLVTVDSNMRIIDEMNIYYNYSNGIYARTKLFFIDKNYKISIRYYYENEEGKTKFTSIITYKVKKDGKIISEK